MGDIVSEPHVVVIGGGVIGAACAHYLVRARRRVTIVDRDAFGAACSHGNCGYIALSHVLPLTEPGAVRKTMKAMGKRSSPFFVKPRLDPTLWSWLLRFARRCNERDMFAAAEIRAHLLRSTGELYDELLDKDGLACEHERIGNLFVYHDTAAWEKYAKTDALLRERFDTPARRIDSKELVDFEPTMRDGLGGGWFYEMDSQVRPDRLMASWKTSLEHDGVELLESTDVRGIIRRGERGAAVDTTAGEIEADTIVVAAGAESPAFQRELGCRIPIQPGKGYSVTMSRPASCPSRSIIFQQHKVALTPFESGFRIGSTMEFSGYDRTLNERRIALLTDGAARYMREPIEGSIEERWFGWRPMTYDDLPIIGPSPAMENVYLATGHGMLGLTLAPVTGKLIAEMVAGEPTHLDASALSVRRFR